ncbi:RES family NAD+ phosphorylase [Verrucomicrobiaceae bacterium 227]
MAFSEPATKASEDPDSLMAYRLVAPKWATSALSGEGARRFGGRWNSPGMPMVYLSGSRALAALELLVHLTTPETRIIPRVLVTVSIPRTLIGGRLWTAPGWQEEPPGKNSTDQGDDWLRTSSTAAVRAPSVLVPEEDNILLNPLHQDFSKVTILEFRTFSYDPRLARITSTLS